MACSTPMNNFVKFSSLLLDEGTFALAERVKYEIDKDSSCTTLSEFLEQNKHKLFHLFQNGNCCQCPKSLPKYDKTPMSLEQWDCLFTDKSAACKTSLSTSRCCCRFVANAKLEISTFDISLLSIILLNVCPLNKNEKEKVKHIRKQRNKYFAHASSTEMDEVLYLKEFKDAKCTLEAIGKAVGNDALRKVQKRIEDLEKSTINDNICRHLIGMIQIQKEIHEKDMKKVETVLQEILTKFEENQVSLKLIF